MEKYTKWKDPYTGLHPFLPPKPKVKAQQSAGQAVGSAVLTFVVGPVLCVVRLALLAVMVPWLALMTGLASLMPVPVVRRFLVRYVHTLGCRAVLFVMGFHRIASDVLHPRQRHLKVDKPDIRNGDIVVCNLASYVQMAYLAFRFSPTFTSLVRADDPNEALCQPRGLFGAVRDVLFDSAPDANNSVPLSTVQDTAATTHGGPVLVFPEATTSNNQLLIRFQPFLPPLLLCRKPRIHVMCVRLDDASTFTVGHPFLHFLKLLSVPNHTLQVRVCADEALPVPPSLPLVRPGMVSKDAQAKADEYVQEVARLMGSLFQLHYGSVGAREKAEFKAYFAQREGKAGYKPKAA